MKSEPMQHILMTSFHRQAHSSERRSFGIMSSSPTSSSSFGGTCVPVAAVAGVQASCSTSTGSNTPRDASPASSSSSSSSSLTSSILHISSFSPDLQAQRTSLEHLLDRKLAEGDFWYVIVAEWLENLKRYVGLNSCRKYYGGQRASSGPGPIVTRRDYAHTVDVVHEDAWRSLVKWYGLADGHKAMKLVVYKYARGPEIEHNINSFKVSLSNSPPENFHIVRFSKMEKIGHVEHKVRQLYAIPQNVESRAWAKADTDCDWRPLFCRDKPIGLVLDIDSDFTRPVVVLETCNVEGKWSGAPESTEVPEGHLVSGYFVENSLFDDVTTSWELDIHDHIDQVGKMFLEKLHGNFDVFVQKGKDYIVGREYQLRERERMVCARESVTERLASRLQAKELRLTEGMEKCEEKIKEYENKRLELEREFLEKQEEAERVLSEKKEKLQKEADELQTSKDNFQKEMEQMTQLGKIQESRIKLDIGGNQFTTSQLTLSKDPDSMLAAMFSGRHELKTESDGSYFIDRDGTHFRYILNYLRDGCIKEGTLPQNDTVYRELLTEAEFYQLENLSDFLRDRLIHKECG